MITRYMLDTETASSVIGGRHENVDARLRQNDPSSVAISCVTRAELRYGVARRPDARRLAAHVQSFLDGIGSEPWNDAAADRYGIIRARSEEAGTSIGILDTMIAAHAIATAAILVTDNERHFARVADLKFENWSRPSM